MNCFHRVLLTTSLVLFAPSAFAAVVYVSDNGTGDGLKATTPIGSLAKECPADNTQASCKAANSSLYRGMRELLKLGGGTLVLVGKVQIDERYSHGAKNAESHDFLLPRHRYTPVTVTGVYNGVDYGKEGAALIVKTPAHVSLNGLTTLEHLNIQTVGDYRAIVCNNAHCVFGEGITVINEKGETPTAKTASSALTVAGGERYLGAKYTEEEFSIRDNHLKTSQIEVYSGVYRRIVGGIFGYGNDVCEGKPTVWVQQGDAYVKIGGNTVVLEGVRVGSNRCSGGLFGDARLWITGGTFHGTIEGVGQSGFLTADSRSLMRIDAGDFTSCKGIYGGSSHEVRGFQPKQSALDISGFDPVKLQSSGLLDAVVRSPGYFGSGVLQVHNDKSAPMDASQPLFYSREKIDVQKYRKSAVDYMVAQASLRWTPTETFFSNIRYKTDPNDSSKLLYLNPGGVWLKHERGERSAGVPYDGNRRTSFEEMQFMCRGSTNGMCTYHVPIMQLKTWENGKERTDPIDRSFLGAVCSSSIFNAWEKGLNGVNIDFVGGTVTMMPSQRQGIVKVGDYTIDPEKGKTYSSSILLWKTKQICDDTGREAMYGAYVKLLPGDAVVWTTPETGTGHVRMVRKAPVINSSDMGASTIELVEQTNAKYRNESDLSNTGWVAENDVRTKDGVKKIPNVHTFKELFDYTSGDNNNGCYIPVRHADLENGVRELPSVRVLFPETAASLTAIRDNPTGNDKLFSSSILSNYRIYGGKMVLERYEPNGDKKVVVSDDRFYWEILNDHKFASKFHYRIIPVGAIGYDDVGYYNQIVQSLRGKHPKAAANVTEGRWSFSFHVMVGEHDDLEVQRVDFIVGNGAHRKVIYDANGAQSGTVPQDTAWYSPGQSAKILDNSGNLVLQGFEFNGWNTQPLAGGTHYQAGDSVEVGKEDTRLYVQWKEAVDGGDAEDAGDKSDVAADARQDAGGGDKDVRDGLESGIGDSSDREVDAAESGEDSEDGGCGCEIESYRGSNLGIRWWGLVAFGAAMTGLMRRRRAVKRGSRD